MQPQKQKQPQSTASRITRNAEFCHQLRKLGIQNPEFQGRHRHFQVLRSARPPGRDRSAAKPSGIYVWITSKVTKLGPTTVTILLPVA